MTVNIVEAIASWAKSQKSISIDESFKQRVLEYGKLISESKKLPKLTRNDMNSILAIVAERAVSIARTTGKHDATREDFEKALLEFKGPIFDPTDRCEGAAVEIMKERNLTARISESLRFLMEADN
jgi:hypothetical protein